MNQRKQLPTIKDFYQELPEFKNMSEEEIINLIDGMMWGAALIGLNEEVGKEMLREGNSILPLGAALYSAMQEHIIKENP